jgi:exodeoxyribonuclease III
MVRIMSWNVNGVRSAAKKGFLEWLSEEAPDVCCLQEIKAHPDVLEKSLLTPFGYKSYWFPAQKPGYSGTAVYTKIEPVSIKNGMDIDIFDSEGRVLAVEFPRFTVVNAYFPNSQREHTRLGYKLEFCQSMLKFLEGMRKAGKKVLLCGDFNIAHKEIDLKNPKSNVNNAGFLPEERAWMDEFVARGWVDTFREFTKDPGHYTWWSYRPGVREKNIGWRLDYHCVNREFMPHVKKSFIQCEVMGSDHCPVAVDLGF